MATYFAVRRDELPGERLYELSQGFIVLHNNPVIRIPHNGEVAEELIEAQERLTWPNLTSAVSIRTLDLRVGSYHPNISRPYYSTPEHFAVPESSFDKEHAKAVWREIGVIVEDIEHCFNVTSPNRKNYQAYGLSYEKIIYFCSIGVEALFRKVLTTNGVSGKKVDMNLFFKLNRYLRLDEYSLSLVRYPWMEELKPFENWDHQNPSSSLHWFHAYNSLKHDKRNSEESASMINALLAAGAFYTVAYAIFGSGLFPGYLSDVFYFHFEARPAWKLEEHYFGRHGEQWYPINIVI